MKRKAIHAEYRKSSESFPDWLKYEITILNENGTTEKVPAYGKDLQDALSRVVHDERVEKLTKKTKVIPWWAWVTSWFGYLGFISFWWSISNNINILAGGILSAMLILVMVMLWSKDRNVERH
jgi:hypothetical protein